MKRTFLIGLVAALLVVWLARRERSRPPTPTVLPEVTQLQGQPSVRASVARTAGHPQASEAPDPCLALLGGEVPVAARPYLVRAVHCAEFIEQRCRQFSPSSTGDGILHSLERKLFIDDYGYAALATGQVDTRHAAQAASTLMTNLQQMAEIPEAVASGERLPLEGAVAERMSKSYETMLAGPNGGYSNVWNVVSSFDPGGQSTDSFKDALAYCLVTGMAYNGIGLAVV